MLPSLLFSFLLLLLLPPPSLYDALDLEEAPQPPDLEEGLADDDADDDEDDDDGDEDGDDNNDTHAHTSTSWCGRVKGRSGKE